MTPYARFRSAADTHIPLSNAWAAYIRNPTPEAMRAFMAELDGVPAAKEAWAEWQRERLQTTSQERFNA